MWQSYFFQLQKKYNMRVSTKHPLIIRFDGKNVTKDKTINLLDMYKGGFIEALKTTVWYFSKKYHCYAILGSDEVSFIFTEPMLIIEDLDSDKTNHSNEIIALFSQYFFDYFNKFYKEQKIFWHGKCFSIPDGKINSYVKYRSRIIKNVMATYFLKRKGLRMGDAKLSEKLDECLKFPDYGVLKKIEDGILYFDGDELDLLEFLNGNTVKIDNNINKTDEVDEDFNIEFLDF